MKTSVLDKLFLEIAPGLAVRRLASKHDYQLMSASSGYGGGYSGAIDSRRRTYQAYNRAYPGTEETALNAYGRDNLRLECRDLFRNNEIVRGAVNRFIEYSIWKGITPQAQSSSTEWNETAEAWWNDIYSKTCDHRQLQGVGLVNLQKLVVSHRIIDGDCGFIRLKNGQVQAVESSLITTPNKFSSDPQVVDGVRRSKNGILLGYYVCPRKNGASVDASKFKYVRKEDFIHCWDPERIDQIRGVPRLAPAVAKLRDYDETDENVLNKIKLDAMQQFKIFSKRQLPNVRGRGAYNKTESGGTNQQRVEKQEWGRIHRMGLDEDMEAFESKTPNSEYVGYMKHELQAIAASLDIPYEFLMLIFTEGSFSSQRAALIHAKHVFTDWHDWVIRSFLTPLWNWRIAKAIKEGTLPAAPLNDAGMSEWWRVDWSMPFFDWVDPDKQVKAEERQLDIGSTSLTSIVKAKGRELKDVMGEKAMDIETAIAQAEAINKTHPGAGVSWRDMIATSASNAARKSEGPAE